MAKKISKKISVVKQTKYSITDDELTEIINKKKDEVIAAKKVSFVNPKIPDKTKQQIYTEDMSDLKQCISEQKMDLNVSNKNQHKKELLVISKILKKYDDKIFYLTYETQYLTDKKIVTDNWKIYTEIEFKNKFPKTFDPNKLCYSNGKEPFDNLEYPTNYKKSTVCYNVEQLAFKHDNLRYVHPELLKVCKYFY